MKNYLIALLISYVSFSLSQNTEKEKFIDDLISKMTLVEKAGQMNQYNGCLLYTSPSPRD